MSLLPGQERVLLGPGPSLTSPRVMRAMAAPTISHLDPLMIRLLDDVRERLLRVFGAEDGSFAFAVSGTGTSGMETVVANLVAPGTRALVIVSGYFGDRLAQMCERYGATVTRLDVEWGRACDPEALRKAMNATRADVVAMVHAETSTGVLNPVESLAKIAREHDALTVVDAVSSLGGQPLDVGAWAIDACYSCTQKCIGGPSGLAPIVFGPRALARRVKCRSFYFDLQLLEDYWIRRKYHHTMSSTLVYALYEALAIVEEEGLEARWTRHERNHHALIEGLAEQGLSVLPREGERLWTLNAVRVPDGVDEAAVRAYLLDAFNVEIGSGLGPLAGKIWRVGLMGASSSPRLIVLLLGALERAFAAQGRRAPV
ncbi:MAG TPA: alanine--glyoxylate aminotransferase family protein [Vicinamibacterales bacterium]|jgi:alanine-glyoxylate transaminase/serine-glyoxylate transaminase/serine-pyruvate transaminase|nr:alanine--glyoxylate aminotransferase family protein [Vicinamibacterales bacterium]